MACKHCNHSREAFYRDEGTAVEIGDYCVIYRELISLGQNRQRNCPYYESW